MIIFLWVSLGKLLSETVYPEAKRLETRMRLLLVEDDPMTSKCIEMMLTHANLNVYSTDLGDEESI